jgi:hypothetical protein
VGGGRSNSLEKWCCWTGLNWPLHPYKSQFSATS